MHYDGAHVDGLAAAGTPVDPGYRKPCVVNRGSKTSPAACGDDFVDLARRQRPRDDGQVDVEMRRRQVPLAVQPLAVRQGPPRQPDLAAVPFRRPAGRRARGVPAARADVTSYAWY